MYDVRKNESVQQPCCQLKCSFCNICIHMMSCTCMDAVIQATLCKHVHFIHQQQMSNTIMVAPSTSTATESAPETEELLNSCVSHTDTNVEQMKERLHAKVTTLAGKLQQVQSLDILKDAEKAVDKLLKFVDIEPSPQSLPQTNRTPGNKKMTVQRPVKPFHSTVRPRKKKTTRLAKPSQSERSKIVSNLLAGRRIHGGGTSREGAPGFRSKTRAKTTNPSFSESVLRRRNLKFRRVKIDPAATLRRKITYRSSGGKAFSWAPMYRRLASK